MNWQVGIEGPGSVLDQLAIVASDRDIRLDAEGGRVVLRASRLDSLDDVASVRREAERIVAVMSGFARLLLGSTEALRVRDVIDARATGVGDRVRSTAHSRPRFDGATSAGDRSTQEGWPQSSLFQSLRLTLDSPTMEAALRLRNADSLDWTAVTQICQVIEEAVGGSSAIARLSGVPTRLIRQLHGPRDIPQRGAERTRARDVADHLTLSDASSLLDRLLVNWLSSVTRRHSDRAW